MEQGQYYPGYAGYGAQQYAYPQKKFPIYVVIAIVIVAVVVSAIAFMMLSQPTTTSLTVSPSFIEKQLGPGTTTTVTVTIQNNENKDVSLILSPTNLPDWVVVDKTVLNLPPSTAGTVTITFSPSSSSTAASGIIYMSNSDAFISIHATVLPPPSVSFSLSQSSLNLKQGSRNTITATIGNTGQTPIVDAAISITGIPEGWIIFDKNLTNVAGGAQTTKTIEFNVPNKAEAGTYNGVVTLAGIGFIKTTSLNLVVAESLGVITISPADITGSKDSGTNIRLTLSNIGNGGMSNITLTPSSGIAPIVSISPSNIAILEAGQSAEVILTLSGASGSYNGNIRIDSMDTHDNVQTKFVTLAISLLGGGNTTV
jgi:uncharacterized membrane protein